jgi:hypothetical protein
VFARHVFWPLRSILDRTLPRSTVQTTQQPPTHSHHPPTQGLEWMLRREQRGDALGRGVLQLHPMWYSFQTECGFVFYMHKCVDWTGVDWDVLYS